MPSTILYSGAVVLALLSLGVGTWHLVAWPQFPNPPIGARELRAATPPPATATPTAAVEVTPDPAPAPPPPPAPEPRRYTVRSGDTLVGIADQFGVGVNEIVGANNLLNPESLQIGQELVIP